MKHSEGLKKFVPIEFDLRNYDEAINLDLLGWYQNLAARKHDYDLSFIVSDEGRDRYRNRFPLSPWVSKLSITELEPNPVEELSCAHALSLQFSIIKKGDLKHLTDGYYHSDGDTRLYLDSIRELKKIPAEGYFNADINSMDIAPILIDLDFSEKQIMEAFSKWLRSVKQDTKRSRPYRNKEPKVKEFTDAEIASWRGSYVLAYLDLTSWNRAVGLKPRHQDIAEILDVSENDIKQKIMPKSLKLIESKTLKRLKYAAIELLEEEN